MSGFLSVKLEGGLLSEEFLAKVSAEKSDLAGRAERDYHLDRRQPLSEAASRSWGRLSGCFKSLRETLDQGAGNGAATGLTREKFLLPLFQELGYGWLPKAKAFEVEGRSFPISHGWNHSPIHLIGVGVSLDERQKGVPGAASSSPHGLVQEFLNRSHDHLWGFLSNGLSLRVLRDHHSLTRQACIEFDLEAIFEGEQFADFRLLYLLCHQSRVESDKPEECWLEKWRLKSREEGVRVLKDLRNGVKSAIESLGQGFLRLSVNQRLHDSLNDGTLSDQHFYRQLLRLVYRLIFLFVAEDRGLLLDPAAPLAARDRCRRFYSMTALRELALRRRGTPHPDRWESLKVTMSQLDSGCQALALPALGSFLWRAEAVPDLLAAQLDNSDLFEAVRALCIAARAGQRIRVNWRDIGSEELGGIYESLLELHPNIERAGSHFELKGDTTGHERKTTGSYYTPPPLVDALLDSALDPVLDEAARGQNPEEAVLGLTVCDPACGSGHFLVAAGRRIAKRLASVRSGDAEPSPDTVLHAMRDVVGRCLYGVDKNDMAVELCKVSLWMEGLEPGRPLSFLDAHILHGNSLLGTTPALMDKGIPAVAFCPIAGDSRPITLALRRENRQERKGQKGLFLGFEADPSTIQKSLGRQATDIDRVPDSRIEEVRKKEQAWRSLRASADLRREKLRADAWCASFVWPKGTSEEARFAVTQDVWLALNAAGDNVPPTTLATAKRLAEDYQFFHWHIGFPQVFFREANGDAAENSDTGWFGGFDVVLGNPPWERVKLQEKEFFATRQPDIANAPNAAARRRMIAELPPDSDLARQWMSAKRLSEGTAHLVLGSGRYPLCGRGDVNTYSIFAEWNRTLLSPRGRVGCIVPTGIATDDTTRYFFRDLLVRRSLASLYDFENAVGLFPGVGHGRFRFSLLTMSGLARPVAEPLFAFYLHHTHQLEDTERRFTLTAEDIALLNPNTGTCPVFRTRRDAEITKGIYRRVPVLIREGDPDGNPWGISFLAMFHMANDSHLFRTRTKLESQGWELVGNIFEKEGERCLPLYEAKMIHHFTHRFGDYRDRRAGAQGSALPDVPVDRLTDPNYRTVPRYWVPDRDVEEKLRGKWDRPWLLGWRDICRAGDVRTVVSGVVPKVGVNDKFLLMLPSCGRASNLHSLLSAFAFDFIARQKLSGSSLKYFSMRQLAVLSPKAFEAQVAWAPQGTTAWIADRVLELTFTAWDLEGFARDCGYSGPPFRWDEERRRLLRAELDAAFFHLYGIEREDVDYILETFPIVKRHDKKKFGDYRTKLLILDAYDRMQRAIDGIEPYRTRLDPPPADPRQAHPPRSEDD